MPSVGVQLSRVCPVCVPAPPGAFLPVRYRYSTPTRYVPVIPRCLFTGTAAAVAHARLRLSRLELIGGSGRTAGRYASAARAFISPTAFEQARGGALGAGGGRVGFAGGGLF